MSDVAPATNSATPPSAKDGKEFKKLGYSLYIKISEDKMECCCSYFPHSQGAMITLDELKADIVLAGVKEGINDEAIKEFAVKAGAGQELLMVLLASGIAPVHGIDGRIEYLVQPDVKEEDPEEEAVVDMKQVQTFLNVTPGEKIAHIIPPIPGTPGKGVTGQDVPPNPGKPVAIKIGKNLTLEEDGTIVSTSDGRVCQVSGEISVEEQYAVPGDVGFKIGSIVFNGFVEVKGDVLDDFNINCTKGMKIGGNVGTCNIQTPGDVAFCGMDGQDKGIIICGGSIRANFIHDSTVLCEGDLLIDVELHNCNVKCLGRIVVNKGAISGGSYIALGGIESKKIGSPASVHTKLIVGVDYRDLEAIDKLTADLKQNQTEIEQTTSLQDIEVLRKARAAITDDIFAIRNKEYPLANAKINVKTVLYDNVLLTIGAINEKTKEQKDGKYSIIENTIEGGLRYLSMTSLDVLAKNIELAFVQEHKMSQKKTPTFIPGGAV
ncbi:MAG: FapA family protein [Deltaproteobacteria bacterium]